MTPNETTGNESKGLKGWFTRVLGGIFSDAKEDAATYFNKGAERASTEVEASARKHLRNAADDIVCELYMNAATEYPQGIDTYTEIYNRLDNQSTNQGLFGRIQNIIVARALSIGVGISAWVTAYAAESYYEEKRATQYVSMSDSQRSTNRDGVRNATKHMLVNKVAPMFIGNKQATVPTSQPASV